MSCYQWPTPKIESSFDDKLLDFDKLSNKIDKVESFFKQYFSILSVLLPSRRACLNTILKLNNISRGGIVWAPKWSFHCVWNAISYFATPTINFTDNPNVYLNVHKWGYLHSLNIMDCKEPAIIIEDSVDSLLFGKEGLFPNNSNYEIV